MSRSSADQKIRTISEKKQRLLERLCPVVKMVLWMAYTVWKEMGIFVNQTSPKRSKLDLSQENIQAGLIGWEKSPLSGGDCELQHCPVENQVILHRRGPSVRRDAPCNISTPTAQPEAPLFHWRKKHPILFCQRRKLNFLLRLHVWCSLAKFIHGNCVALMKTWSLRRLFLCFWRTSPADAVWTSVSTSDGFNGKYPFGTPGSVSVTFFGVCHLTFLPLGSFKKKNKNDHFTASYLNSDGSMWELNNPATFKEIQLFLAFEMMITS